MESSKVPLLEITSLKGVSSMKLRRDIRVTQKTAWLMLHRIREAFNTSVGKYVRGQVHTNGVESFWSMLKRGYIGVYHRMSPKHLQRYVNEFAGRHNIRDMDTIDQMNTVVCGLVGKRLLYRDLTAPSDLSARAT